MSTSRSNISFNPSPGLNVFQTVVGPLPADVLFPFQSLTWVERLSDPHQPPVRVARWRCFNPSPGLNVFQTPAATNAQDIGLPFQSLTWVERLSDPNMCRRCSRQRTAFQSLTWVERLSDPVPLRRAPPLSPVSIPHLG